MKKQLLWLTGLLAGAFLSLQAAETNGTFDLGYTTDYVFRGIKKTDAAITNGIQVDFAPLYAGIYGVESLRRSAQRAELNFYVGRKAALNENTTFDAGLTAYWFPDEDVRGTKYSFEGYAGLTRRFTDRWSASLYGYYDVNRQALTVEGSTGYSIPLSEQASLRFSGFLGTVDARDFYPEFPGAHIKDTYSYYGLTADVPVKLSEQVSVVFGLKYGDNLNLRGGRPYSDTTYGFARLVMGF